MKRFQNVDTQSELYPHCKLPISSTRKLHTQTSIGHPDNNILLHVLYKIGKLVGFKGNGLQKQKEISKNSKWPH